MRRPTHRVRATGAALLALLAASCAAPTDTTAAEQPPAETDERPLEMDEPADHGSPTAAASPADEEPAPEADAGLADASLAAVIDTYVLQVLAATDAAITGDAAIDTDVVGVETALSQLITDVLDVAGSTALTRDWEQRTVHLLDHAVALAADDRAGWQYTANELWDQTDDLVEILEELSANALPGSVSRPLIDDLTTALLDVVLTQAAGDIDDVPEGIEGARVAARALATAVLETLPSP